MYIYITVSAIPSNFLITLVKINPKSQHKYLEILLNARILFIDRAANPWKCLSFVSFMQ